MRANSARVHVDRLAGRATVEWDRPPLNIFDIALLEELSRALEREEVRSAKVVVLRGAGPSFSAGVEVREHCAPQLSAMLAAFGRTLRTLWDLPVPTIAQVQGRCLGGGMELLFACDLAYASSSATFAQPEVRLGVFAPFGVAHYPRALGARRAYEILLTGGSLTAAEAEAAGVINHAVSEAELPAAVALCAQTLCQYRGRTLRLLKRALRASGPDPFAGLGPAEALYTRELMAGPDAEEGLRAFLEKRAPLWEEG